MVAHNQSAGHVTFRPFSKPENPEAPYLTVQSDKPVALPGYSEHSLWTVEHLPNDEVALKGYNGHYLSVNSHFQVHMAKELSKESHLQFVTHADFPGCVAIKETVHHTFLAFDAHGHLNVKKGCSEKDFPADLPYFAKHDLNTAVKEHHHGGHHAHHRHEHK